MYEDSIQTASSVEVVESEKRSFLRPVAFKGGSFLAEHDDGRKPDVGSAPKVSSSTARSRPSPAARRATYQPDWTSLWKVSRRDQSSGQFVSQLELIS
jgi:hypothetical protein